MGDVSMMTKEMIVSHKPLVEEEEEDGWRRDVDVDLTLPGPEHLDPMAEQRMVQPGKSSNRIGNTGRAILRVRLQLTLTSFQRCR